MNTRQLSLAPGRFERWWEKFQADHPGVTLSIEAGQAVLASTDGSVATFAGWYPLAENLAPGLGANLAENVVGDHASGLVENVADNLAENVVGDLADQRAGRGPAAGVQAELLRAPEQIGIILLRRGGYSIGYAQGTKLVDHKTGTRYVQARTAAGGWSQQRFARRRSNQADELVRACSEVAERILRPLNRSESGGLVLGGDDLLLAQLLTDPRLAALTKLPRRVLTNIPDPRFTVLSDALTWANGVSVTVHNP